MQCHLGGAAGPRGGEEHDEQQGVAEGGLVAGGVALALMETLADFGTVQYFGVSTFTTGIYRTWFALGEPAAAAQLAGVLMLFVLLVLTLEGTEISAITWFADSSVFPHFGLPRTLR